MPRANPDLHLLGRRTPRASRLAQLVRIAFPGALAGLAGMAAAQDAAPPQ